MHVGSYNIKVMFLLTQNTYLVTESECKTFVLKSHKNQVTTSIVDYLILVSFILIGSKNVFSEVDWSTNITIFWFWGAAKENLPIYFSGESN